MQVLAATSTCFPERVLSSLATPRADDWGHLLGQSATSVPEPRHRLPQALLAGQVSQRLHEESSPTARHQPDSKAEARRASMHLESSGVLTELVSPASKPLELWCSVSRGRAREAGTLPGRESRRKRVRLGRRGLLTFCPCRRRMARGRRAESSPSPRYPMPSTTLVASKSAIRGTSRTQRRAAAFNTKGGSAAQRVRSPQGTFPRFRPWNTLRSVEHSSWGY